MATKKKTSAKKPTKKSTSKQAAPSRKKIGAKASAWKGQPLADFLKSIAKDKNKADLFRTDPSMVDDEPGLTASQKAALKSGCMKNVLHELISPEEDGAITGGIYFTSRRELRCDHADCNAFQNAAHGAKGDIR